MTIATQSNYSGSQERKVHACFQKVASDRQKNQGCNDGDSAHPSLGFSGGSISSMHGRRGPTFVIHYQLSVIRADKFLTSSNYWLKNEQHAGSIFQRAVYRKFAERSRREMSFKRESVKASMG